jgi:hypothetical protein
MKTNKLIKTTFTAALLSVAITLQAQVTIGDIKEPESFSVLELVSNQNGGLRMPLLTTGERTIMTASTDFQNNATTLAKGLTIYNTTNDCLEFWNGEEWISTCEGEAMPVLFDPIYNVDAGTTTLNLDVVFVQGSGDDKTRGTGVTYSEMAAGVFRYTGATGQAFEGTATTVKGITVTSPATTLANGAGELTISVSGTPTAVTAGSAFDIPITVLGQQLYVRVHVGCGGYTSIQYTAIPKTIPSTEGDPAWQQFQCFNLGADTSINDPLTYVEGNADGTGGTLGALYQWGRTTDGHQLRNSTVTTLTTQLTTVDPGTSDFLFYGTFNDEP